MSDSSVVVGSSDLHRTLLYSRLGFDGLLNLACRRAGTGSGTMGAREVLYIIVGPAPKYTQIPIHIHILIPQSPTSGPEGDANSTAHPQSPSPQGYQHRSCRLPAINLPAATFAGSQPRAGRSHEPVVFLMDWLIY